MKVIDTLHRGEARPCSLPVRQDRATVYTPYAVELAAGREVEALRRGAAVTDLLHEQNWALAEDPDLVAGRSPAAAAAADRSHLVRAHHHEVGPPRLSQPDDFPCRLAD